MRKAYLDNIRWAAVLLVLAYHVFYMFNGVGVPGGMPGAKNIPACDYLACMVYPWFMVLLFIIAGMSARYALQKRTVKQFLKERAVKLLVPATLGLFVVHWVTGYLNLKIGGGLAYIPAALVYPVSVISGIGPLWFIQMLFGFSCILALLRKIDRADKVWAMCGKANLPAILLLSLVVFGAAQVLNMPVLTMYRFGIYFVSFLIGYYIFSHEEVQARIGKIRVPALCFAVACAVLYARRYGGGDYTAPACLQSLLTNLYLWAAVLAAIGWGREYFNQETAFTRYMAKASYGLYILHYPALIAVCYLLQNRFALPAIWNYAIAFAMETILSLLGCEAIKRVPVVRYLVLGMKSGHGEKAQA